MGEYDEAIRLYGEAIQISKSDHVLYSNRSAAYAGAKKYEEALADASECIRLKPDFAKGYSRKGLAQYHLDQLKGAKQSYEEGLKLDPQNTVLQSGLRDAKKGFRSWFLKVLGEVADDQ